MSSPETGLGFILCLENIFLTFRRVKYKYLSVVATQKILSNSYSQTKWDATQIFSLTSWSTYFFIGIWTYGQCDSVQFLFWIHFRVPIYYRIGTCRILSLDPILPYPYEVLSFLFSKYLFSLFLPLLISTSFSLMPIDMDVYIILQILPTTSNLCVSWRTLNICGDF